MRNSEAALMVGSGLKSFMTLQSSCQMVCSYLKALLGLKDLFQNGSLIWCWLLVGGLSFFPHGSLQAAWVSLRHGSWLPPMWVIQNKAKQKPLCLFDLTMEVTDCHFYNTYWLHWSALFTVEGDQTGMWTEKQGSLGAFLKACYHNYSISQQPI